MTIVSQVKTRKRKADADGIHCPICNETTAEDINVHVEICLRKTENNSIGSDDESIDVEAESYEQYEWAGQTRIRASSMLEGGYSGAGNFYRIPKAVTCKKSHQWF